MKDFLKGQLDKPDEELYNLDCGGYDYIPTIIGEKDIVAIGDLHGDFDLLIRCLTLASVIDKDHKWIGGEIHVVQIGDQIDSCRPTDRQCNDPEATVNDKPHDMKILMFMTDLNKQARKTKGRVINLMGNHELKWINGDFGYASYNNVQSFKDYKDPSQPDKIFSSAEEAITHAFTPGNEYANYLACTRQSVVVIGKFIFVHGGIVPNYLRKLQITSQDDLRLFNSFVRKYLLGLIKGAKVEDLIYGSSESIFWNRLYGMLKPNLSMSDETCNNYLKKVLKILNVSSMIIGHTIQFSKNNEGMNPTCDNGVYRIDHGGSSQAFDKFDEATKMGDISKTRKAQAWTYKNGTIRVIRFNK